MTIKTAWNTGRQYTAKGQRIAARVLPNLTVAFFDVDRGVWGSFPLCLMPSDAYALKQLVISHYDCGSYAGTIDPLVASELRRDAEAL